jgi:hypothetical protein
MGKIQRTFGQYRLPLGVISTVGGCLLILSGYVGISGTRVVSDQLSYLMSGGLGGVALVMIGMSLLLVDYFVRLESSIQAATATSGAVYDGSEPPSIDSNGNGPETISEVVVLPGAGRFHLSSCSMVARRRDVKKMAVKDALAQRLARCSLCVDPTRVPPEVGLSR